MTDSLMFTHSRSRAAMAAQAAPATTAASIMRTSSSEPGRSGRASATPAAATPPMTSWPSPPTFTRPARAGMATARAARMIGVPRTKISPTLAGLENVDVIMLA